MLVGNRSESRIIIPHSASVLALNKHALLLVVVSNWCSTPRPESAHYSPLSTGPIERHLGQIWLFVKN